MAYNSGTNQITRAYRFGTADDAEDGDGITQVQHDFALDEMVTDINALALDIFSRLKLIVIDTFTGDGVTTSFALSGTPASEDNLFVHLDGVYQNKSAFYLSGSNLVFTTPPPNNADMEVLALSTPNVGISISTFVVSDTTPSVLASNTFLTDVGVLTITDFDEGTTGQEITVISKGAITFDTTGTNLTGSSVDLVTADGDVTRWICEDGTTWRLIGFVNASADNSAGA